MDELLAKILATDVLSESTKAELSEAFTQLISEQVAEAKQLAEAEVRAQLAEQWVNEREALIDAMDAQINEALQAELAELKNDIAAFRDLEVEHAAKIVEAKQELAEQLDGDIVALAEQIDSYLEGKLRAELADLNESIEIVKRNELGRKVFEMFASEYQSSFVNKTVVEKKLARAKRIERTLRTKLAEKEKERMAVIRESKMTELLSTLSGKQKSIMETILKAVPTEQLDESFNMFLPRVISEGTKQSKPLNEGTEARPTGRVVTGNGTSTIVESADRPQTTVSTEILSQFRTLAGI